MAVEYLPPAGRLLRQLSFLLNPKKARKLTATFAFRLTGAEGGDYSLGIDRGECGFRTGLADNPTVLVEMPARVWLDLAVGRLSSRQAAKAGMKIRGNRLLMLRFNALFSGDPVAADVPAGLYGETENEEAFRRGAWTPPRRVLGVQASPRKRDGATEWVYTRLAAGMATAGAVVDTVYLPERAIKPCTGCYACWKKTDGRCVIKDDMAGLLEGVPSYDLMVIAAPLYVDSIPGGLKNFLDRLIPLNHPYIFNKNGRCRHPSRYPCLPNLALAAVCGFYELENFLPLVTQMEATSHNLHMPLLATLLRPHAMILRGDIPLVMIERLEAALQKAGSVLVAMGKVSKKLRKVISQPLVSRGHFLAAGKHWWEEDSESPTETDPGASSFPPGCHGQGADCNNFGICPEPFHKGETCND